MQAVEVNFDGITYAKGASVLKQLVAYVGLDNFLAGVRDYFNEHAWGNTELKDLLGALERTSGRDLSSWSKEWLETAWVNTLRPSFERDADGRFTSFEVLQEAPADYPTLRSHRVAIGLYSLHRRRADPYQAGGARRGGRPHGRRRAGRRGAARPGADQRRRPHVRQGPAGRTVAAHAGRRRHRRLHRVAAPRAVLVRGLGHDP